MKKIYFLILVFSAFLLSCGSEDSVTSAVTQTPATLTALYDESNTSKSISVGDTLDAYTKNFELTYNDGTSSSSITVTKDMITLDTTTVGEKVATISYNGLNTTTSAIVCTSASAFTVSSNTIAAYSGSETSVVVPKYINSTEITTLGNSVFNGNTTLTSVIANNITTIADGKYIFTLISTFGGCTKLTSVSFPLATSIGDYAFDNCTGLTTVSLPLATSVGAGAFNSCTGLTTVSLPLATSVGEIAFLYCSALTTVSLPKVTAVGQYAFAECSNLTSVTFGVLPTILGSGIFQFSTTPTNTTDWTIYVPTGTSSAYSSAFLSATNTFFNRQQPTITEF